MAWTALHHRAFRAMNCDMGLWLADTSAETAAGAFDEVEAWIIAAEQRLSRFQPESELSRLNAAGGGQVSDLLWDVVTAALAAAQTSGGLFDPTVLPALMAAGYHRSFDELDRWSGGDARLEAAPGRWFDVGLDVVTRTVTLPSGVWLDLGGIAKGLLADAAVDRLATCGPALADLGGDIAARGGPAGQPGWAVSIADPTHPEEDLVVLHLLDGAIATSGRDYRMWTGPDGSPQHHIIDPRTGRPAVTDALSVSVVAAKAADAEVNAKAALIRGVDDGVAYLAEQGAQGLSVRVDGTVHQTPRFPSLVWSARDMVGV